MGANNCCDRESTGDTKAKPSSYDEVVVAHEGWPEAVAHDGLGYREAPPSVSEYGGGELSMETSVVEASPPLGVSRLLPAYSIVTVSVLSLCRESHLEGRRCGS